MAYDIGPKIGIEGEKQFRESLLSINQNIKTLGSEMTSVVSSFADGEKSEEALAAQTDVLTRQISAQREKLKMLTEMMEKSADKYGENDTKTLKWKQAVYEATTQLNKMEGQLEDVSKDVDDFGDDLDDGAKSAVSFGDMLKANVIGNAITSGLGAVANGIKNVVGAMKDSVVDSAAYADEILTLSTNTGLSTDTLQELKYMAELTDTSLETITGSMAKLTKNMANAQEGTGAAAEAFAALGVSITNEDGTLRNNQEVFQDVIDVLAAMENETQRDAYAMQIFGKSAQDLNSFMAQGSEGIAALAAEAHNVGAVLDGETLGALGGVDDALQRFDGSMSALKNNIISQFAPAIATGIESVNSFLNGEIDAGQFVDTIGGIVFDAADQFLENLPAIVEAGGQVVGALISGVVELFPKILEVGTELLTTIVNGIASSLPELIPATVGIVMQIVETLTNPDTLVNLIDAGINLLVALVEGIVKAVPDLLAQIPVIVMNIVTALVTSLPKILAAGVQLLLTLGNGIVNAIPQLAAMIPQIITTIVNGIKTGISKIKEIGKNIVNGLWEGIKSMWTKLKENVLGLFDGLTSGISKLLGIHSPSRVFAEIGGFMAEGLGIGFDDEIGDVQKQINSSMADMIPDTSASIALGSTGAQAQLLAESGGLTAAALKEALSGMAIYMSGRKVGTLISTGQAEQSRARGVAVAAM